MISTKKSHKKHLVAGDADFVGLDENLVLLGVLLSYKWTIHDRRRKDVDVIRGEYAPCLKNLLNQIFYMTLYNLILF